ncbi:hypothetical protein CDIK_0796 [Cucumispora dikerogammari]|nr:hypothetical protein CDIK_0796 [Cucumispora dikerogammari]
MEINLIKESYASRMFKDSCVAIFIQQKEEHEASFNVSLYTFSAYNFSEIERQVEMKLEKSFNLNKEYPMLLFRIKVFVEDTVFDSEGLERDVFLMMEKFRDSVCVY